MSRRQSVKEWPVPGGITVRAYGDGDLLIHVGREGRFVEDVAGLYAALGEALAFGDRAEEAR